VKGAVDTSMAVKNSMDRVGQVQDERLAAALELADHPLYLPDGLAIYRLPVRRMSQLLRKRMDSLSVL